LNNGAVIGIGRIIGDRGLYYYIQDLIVHPDYQRKGLGTRLMTKLMDYIKENARSGSFIGLMAAQGSENYYKQFGFKARPADRPGMFFII